MPRRKTAVTEVASTEALALNPPHEPELQAAPTASEDRSAGEHQQRLNIPDPRPWMQASLGDDKGSPKITLRRSQQFNQMQIRSDEPLSEKHQTMLRDAGWKDRTEQEGIYTKQLPKGEDEHGKKREKWREAADAERIFKQIANDIRNDRGLGSVLSM